MKKSIFMASVVLLFAGCTSPTKELYNRNEAICPVRCEKDGWSGWVQVEPRFIICVCKDESFKETK